MVIPKHFIPPMIVNGALGYVLWSTYSSTSDLLEPHLPNSPICVAALSGAVAGGTQALVAAPAENVRLAIEGGSTSARGWSHAWKEVFRGTRTAETQSRIDEVHEARQVRDWMKEVGEMAGRGWDGWAWGCAKDICGTLYLLYLLLENDWRKIRAAKSVVLSSDEIQHSHQSMIQVFSAVNRRHAELSGA